MLVELSALNLRPINHQGYLVLVGKDIELDDVDHQFEPYPYCLMCLHAGGALVM